MVGSRGSRLSVGQRQRLALARALLRQPMILLLDEATSAIDSESEALILMALEKFAKGRTTVSVAHRLSTIRKAGRIYVLQQGRIVEDGTHEQLLQRRGLFWELNEADQADEDRSR